MLLCALALLSLGKRPTICIDPGHPSENGNGAKGKRTTELHVAWAVSCLVRDQLKRDGYTVVMTKSTEGQFVKNKDRAAIANKAKSDLFLRIHLDSGAARGFATYRPILAGKGKPSPSAAVVDASKKLAGPFHKAVVKELGGYLKDRGLMTEAQTHIGRKQGALTGSVFSKVPVLLVEVAVVSNPADEALVADEKGQARVAKAIVRGVRAAVPVRRGK